MATQECSYTLFTEKNTKDPQDPDDDDPDCHIVHHRMMQNLCFRVKTFLSPYTLFAFLLRLDEPLKSLLPLRVLYAKKKRRKNFKRICKYNFYLPCIPSSSPEPRKESIHDKNGFRLLIT